MAGPSPYIARLARKYGKKYGIKPSHLLGLIEIESGFNAGAVSSANAQGLTQFIPGTAASYDVKYGTGKKAMKSQVKGAAHYLKDLGYGKDKKLALASYNAGPGNPGAAGSYPQDVLAAAKAYREYNQGKVPSLGGGPKMPKGPGVGGTAPAPLVNPLDDPSYQRIANASALAQELPEGFDRSAAVQERGYDIMQEMALEDATERAAAANAAAAAKGGVKGLDTNLLSKKQQKADGKGIKPGGGYHGTEGLAKGLAKGMEWGSMKRPTKYTASGGISDHWEGNKNSYAIDLPAAGKAGNKIVRILARRLGVSPKQLTGTFNSIMYKGYRIQVLWQVADHYDHVHLGVSVA